MSEDADNEQEAGQQQVREQPEQRVQEGGSGITSKEETPPLRRDSSSPTEDVRLWVLEISTSGLIDTPRMHTVRRERTAIYDDDDVVGICCVMRAALVVFVTTSHVVFLFDGARISWVCYKYSFFVSML